MHLFRLISWKTYTARCCAKRTAHIPLLHTTKTKSNCWPSSLRMSTASNCLYACRYVCVYIWYNMHQQYVLMLSIISVCLHAKVYHLRFLGFVFRNRCWCTCMFANVVICICICCLVMSRFSSPIHTPDIYHRSSFIPSSSWHYIIYDTLWFATIEDKFMQFGG